MKKSEPIVNSDVFSYDDYRQFISNKVKGDTHAWGAWGRLAEAAGCQSTYLSQAMKGKAHLTADHIIAIADFWDFSEAETEFLLLILDYQKAGSKKLKTYFESKIKKIRDSRNDLKKRINQPQLQTMEKEMFYYSAWYWAAIHVLVSIEGFQHENKVANRLNLPVDFVVHALHQLQNYGLVMKKGDRWILGMGDIHIPKTSPMVSMHHNHWRQRGVLDASLNKSESVHFTAVYSMSIKDYTHLKEKILDLIEYSRKLVTDSNEEELVCFTSDIFFV